MQQHPYFETDRVIVMAHRGMTPPAENTLEAFQNALRAGAGYLETDVRATSDGIAVLAHDKDLTRVFGVSRLVSEITFEEFKKLEAVEGGQPLSLAEALTQLPGAKFNIDIKDKAAIEPTVRAIEEHSAHKRVLVSSFSNRRRLAAIKKFSQPVATSASASVMIKAVLWNILGRSLDGLLAGIGAVQVPTRMFGINFKKRSFIRNVKASNTQIHFWTINTPAEIEELLNLGADGIVTDDAAMAVKAVENF